jgi:hypothetical protein
VLHRDANAERFASKIQSDTGAEDGWCQAAHVVIDVAVAVIKSLDMGHLLHENGGKFKAGKTW